MLFLGSQTRSFVPLVFCKSGACGLRHNDKTNLDCALAIFESSGHENITRACTFEQLETNTFCSLTKHGIHLASKVEVQVHKQFSDGKNSSELLSPGNHFIEYQENALKFVICAGQIYKIGHAHYVPHSYSLPDITVRDALYSGQKNSSRIGDLLTIANRKIETYEPTFVQNYGFYIVLGIILLLVFSIACYLYYLKITSGSEMMNFAEQLRLLNLNSNRE